MSSVIEMSNVIKDYGQDGVVTHARGAEST